MTFLKVVSEYSEHLNELKSSITPFSNYVKTCPVHFSAVLFIKMDTYVENCKFCSQMIIVTSYINNTKHCY